MTLTNWWFSSGPEPVGFHHKEGDVGSTDDYNKRLAGQIAASEKNLSSDDKNCYFSKWVEKMSWTAIPMDSLLNRLLIIPKAPKIIPEINGRSLAWLQADAANCPDTAVEGILPPKKWQTLGRIRLSGFGKFGDFLDRLLLVFFEFLSHVWI